MLSAPSWRVPASPASAAQPAPVHRGQTPVASRVQDPAPALHADAPVAVTVAPSRPARPLRVLHLAAGRTFGGVETMLTTLARERELAPGVEVAFALAFAGRTADELRALGVPVDVLPAARLRAPLSIVRARRALARVLAARRPDVVLVHAPWSLAMFGGTLRRAGVPFAMYAHDAVDAPQLLDRLAARARPALVVANSAYTASLARPVFARTPRVVVSAPPISPSAPTPPAERARLRAELGVEAGELVILQVSRLERYKGQDVLVRALGELPRALRWRCWLVGGADRPEQQAFAEELRAIATEQGIADRVALLGTRADARALMAAADIFCHPHTGNEAFGLAFVEAMSAGLPIVTSTVGAPPEVVSTACGLIVPPRDPDAVAAALMRLCTDPGLRARLGAAGPSRVEALCSPARRLPELYATLRELVTRGAAA